MFEKKNKFGIPQLFEEKRRRYTSTDFAKIAEVSGAKDTIERTKLTVVIDKLKENGKDDLKIEDKIAPNRRKNESVANGNMAKNAIFRKTPRAWEQTFLQVFDNLLRRCRLGEREYMVLSEKNNSGFITFHLPPGAYDKTDHNILLDNMAKVNLSTTVIREKARLITNITSKSVTNHF